MEEYGNTVINLHANQTQIISKNTSKTNQNEPLMGAMGGGLPPAQLQLPVGVRGIHSGEARTPWENE